MSVSSWIDELPDELTAYLDPDSQLFPKSTLSKRKALEEMSWNKVPISSSREGNNETPPRHSSPIRALRSTKARQKRTRADLADDDDETPRARRELRTSSNPFVEPPVFPPPGPSSPSRSSRSSALSSPRSKSPSKRLGDLQLISRTITYVTVKDKTFPLPTAAEELTSKIWKISKGRSLIPESMRAAAQQYIEEDQLDDYNFDQTPQQIQIPGTYSAAEVWDRAQEIWAAAALCEGDLCSESAWNSEVHCRLLRLALQGWRSARNISYMDVTTARIDGSSAGVSKMVDYSLVLCPDYKIHKAILAKLRNGGLLSINHSRAEYVRFKPITASIETKRPGIDEDGAKVQLGVWAAAHLERLRMLCGPDAVLPVLPEVIVQGHDWRLKIASMTGDGDVVLHGDWVIGETRSVIGVYKILAAIQALAEWSIADFQPWFLREVLGVGSTP